MVHINLMGIVIQYNALALCLWILGSIVIAISLLLLSVFDGKRDELRENVIYPEGSFTAAITDALIGPQERLKKLEGKITTKCARLEISQEKIEETKRTISELEVTSGEVQVRYQELLKQLKSELAKTEAECQHLHDQIETITTKRDKLKQELDVAGNVLNGSKEVSSTNFDDKLFLSDTRLQNDKNMYASDRMKHPKLSQNWSHFQQKFSFALDGLKNIEM